MKRHAINVYVASSGVSAQRVYQVVQEYQWQKQGGRDPERKLPKSCPSATCRLHTPVNRIDPPGPDQPKTSQH